MKTLHVLDASSFIYRSFFALPPLKTSKGFPTGAIYGFLRALFSIFKNEKPTHMAVVFDSPAPSKREKVYKEYKAGRPSMPNDLKLQIPLIKELVKLLGIPTIEKEGYEADDLIASLAINFPRRGFFVKIYTPDKDMLQLVNDKVIVVNPMNSEIFDRDKVIKKFGVPPEKLADFLALVGDKIDNIKGVKGIGPKRALEILRTFGGVENILENWERFKRLFPHADKEELELSYYLVKPQIADFDLAEEEVKIKEPDLEGLKAKLLELEMKSLIKDLDKIFKTKVQGTLF